MGGTAQARLEGKWQHTSKLNLVPATQLCYHTFPKAAAALQQASALDSPHNRIAQSRYNMLCCCGTCSLSIARALPVGARNTAATANQAPTPKNPHP